MNASNGKVVELEIDRKVLPDVCACLRLLKPQLGDLVEFPACLYSLALVFGEQGERRQIKLAPSGV